MDNSARLHEIGTLSGINKIVKNYKTIALAAIFLSFLTFVISLWTAISFYSSAAQQIFIARDTRIEKVSDKKFMVEAHVTSFLKAFFAIDANNYRSSTEQALYLIGNQGKALYNTYKEGRWFDQIVQNNLHINVDIDSVQVDMSQYPYMVTFTSKMVMQRENETSKRFLNGRCHVIDTSNSQNNPFGLQITDFTITKNDDYVETKKTL